MIIQVLNHLWQKKKRSLSAKLQKGIPELAGVLKSVCEEQGYSQKMEHNEIQWLNREGGITVLFFYIPDPRDLGAIQWVFKRAKETECDLSCLFVQQWMDGDGNWDVFGLNPKRGLVHWNRFWGKRWVEHDDGPHLNKHIYSLFQTGQKFPLFSEKKWQRVLEKSMDEISAQFARLAEEHGCSQDRDEGFLVWHNKQGGVELLLSLYKEFPDFDEYIRIYKYIRFNKCPVTFLFQKAHKGVFDIFRLSARSYLEHHNQVK